MGAKQPKIQETYSQVENFLQQVKADADLNTQFLLLQQKLENYKQETDITKMIWDAINENKRRELESEKNKIKWGAIFERIVTTVIIAVIVALVMLGLNRG